MAGCFSSDMNKIDKLEIRVKELETNLEDLNNKIIIYEADIIKYVNNLITRMAELEKIIKSLLETTNINNKSSMIQSILYQKKFEELESKFEKLDETYTKTVCKSNDNQKISASEDGVLKNFTISQKDFTTCQSNNEIKKKYLNFAEAMRALLEGKKIRDSNWHKEMYIYIEDDILYDEDKNDIFTYYIDTESRYEIVE